MDLEKKLYKSNKNKMIDGVCGGIGEYFNIDPTLVRLGFVALCIFAGGGLLAYIVALVIIPRAPEGYDPRATQKQTTAESISTNAGEGETATEQTPPSNDESDTPTMI